MAQLDAGTSSYPRAGPVVIFGGAGVGVDLLFRVLRACVAGVRGVRVRFMRVASL